jgi:predicted RNA-binding protein with PIN domain
MAMHLIVDGYNVASPSRNSDLGMHYGLQERREILIDELRRYKRAKGFHVTVVFDGQSGPGSATYAKSDKGIRVVFSLPMEKADDTIVRMVRDSSAGVVVVTSDSELGKRCHYLGASVISATEFRERMATAFALEMKGEQDDGGERDVSPVPQGKKGRGHKLTKRIREDRRKLNRL